jgi:biopolymer transport protein ExbB
MQTTSLLSLLQQAGWTMWPLYLCSLVALTVLIRKGLQFRLGRVTDGSPVDALESTELDDEGLARLETAWQARPGPLARVLLRAVRVLRTHPEQAEGAATRTAIAELDHYGAWLALLGFIAQVAPLFGLLGTVIGMIDLFSSMEAAGTEVSTSTLSAGIYKALLTTAAGLMVAIPALAGHLYFTRALEVLQHRMEAGVGGLLAGRGRARP